MSVTWTLLLGLFLVVMALVLGSLLVFLAGACVLGVYGLMLWERWPR